MNNMWERVKEFTWRDKMEKLIRDVLEKYRRKNLPSEDLAKLIYDIKNFKPYSDISVKLL